MVSLFFQMRKHPEEVPIGHELSGANYWPPPPVSPPAAHCQAICSVALRNGGPLKDEQRTAAGCSFICSLSGGCLVFYPVMKRAARQGRLVHWGYLAGKTDGIV